MRSNDDDRRQRRKQEELLGQRPARRECRPRHEADAGAATRKTRRAIQIVLLPAALYSVTQRRILGKKERLPCGSLRAGVCGVCCPYLDSGKNRHRGGQLHLATAIRTAVVLLMSWGMVFLTGTQTGIADISRRSWLFLVLSGLATGASWLCYYHALQVGAASKVVPIDKLSVVITLALAFVVLHEPFTAKASSAVPHHRRYAVYGVVTRYAKRLLHVLCSSVLSFLVLAFFQYVQFRHQLVLTMVSICSSLAHSSGVKRCRARSTTVCR